jgi:hypothetical protein
MRFARAFGLDLDFGDLRPPGAWTPREPSSSAVRLELVRPAEIDAVWSGAAAIGWQATIDGAPFTIEIGRDGDHRFLHGHAGRRCDIHHLSADRRLLLCAPSNPDQPLWWRALLDTVLFTVALLHGRQALHAAAVATRAGAIAITARSGGGKSTLLAELLRGGLPLLADDILALEPQRDGAPLAHPAPPLVTLPAGAGESTPALGKTIAVLEQERWLAVPTQPTPMPLAAIVLLDRHGDPPGHVRPVSRTLAPLIASLLRFPPTSAREQARFEFAGELSERVPMLALSAPPTAPPARLVELLAQQETFELAAA